MMVWVEEVRAKDGVRCLVCSSLDKWKCLQTFKKVQEIFLRKQTTKNK